MSKLLRTTVVAHMLLREMVREGDVVVDATAGNGHDTLFLAKLVGIRGKVYAFDIQEEALKKTERLLAQHNCLAQVEFIHDGHEKIGQYIKEQVRCVMYNLGYLPGGDKSIITQGTTTISSLEQATHLLSKEGVISLMVYSGHPGGLSEAEEVECFVKSLASPPWHVLKWQKINGTQSGPYLMLLYKMVK
ncbi:MAG: class I SAM-dependent methyltransferase [Bacillota bacterium]|uniref:Methyltransferase domain-containing protein n=1 Tax=Thermanaerosceptrum fracticalcis TaxID=1712410 RepID=A0A7G6E0E3_THEFR|nr:class I SAM-dependent methyltransferase [Thermanaerosceptrum fracticalcis]QNB45547.1 methyltransferase domain-containing protein [Thermanaerosceptrum fracticalcis]